jgi:acetyltransferase-like isoleucine patch superfamily enzyme
VDRTGIVSASALSPGALFWRVRDARPERLLHRWRRAVLIVRTRIHAEWHRSTIDLDLDPDVRIGRDVRIDLLPHSTNVLHIGSGVRVDDRVLFRMNGGQIEVGPDCHLRKDVVLNVGGRLDLVAANILGWSTVVHCSESVTFERFASAAEHTTVADSTHYFTEPDAFFYENTRSAPIHIGANTWLCPKATITSGVRVGQHCIIGSNSVVVRDVPDGHLASGIPAATRPIDLPWEGTSG